MFSLLTCAVIFGILIVSCVLAEGIYNIFFHPLMKFPGPKLWAASAIPSAISVINGKPHLKILELHNQYGDIVRVGPNELAFAHANAWTDVCGHLKRGQSENEKHPHYSDEKVDSSLISASRERHGPHRRMLSHAFSARAMAEQQPMINEYISLLMRRLTERGKKGTRALNMTEWYNWTTFDIIGDLAFGESFGCLQNCKSHPWVDILFESMKSLPLLQVLQTLPLYDVVKPLLFAIFVPRDLFRKNQDSIEWSEVTLGKRLDLETSRPDFVDAMLRKKKAGYVMTRREMIDTSRVLTTAGSETTATTLTAVTYFLGTHPAVLARLTAEVHSAFTSEDDIDINSVQNLPFMLAVLKETLRVYPAVPISLPRQAPSEGTQIAGHFIAGGTKLGIWQYALYHSPSKFLYPDSFVPDRWLDDPLFENDCKELHQPFSYGPRNCIGMNLAYVEMRLILARLVWNFELQLAADCRDWVKDQSIYFFWDKPPLNVYLKPRRAK